MPLPGGRRSLIDDLVNLRLDNIVYDIYRSRSDVFGPPHHHLQALRLQFEDCRNFIAGHAPDEHFRRIVKRNASTHGIELPVGREYEFADWIYASPDRCPGLRLSHEVGRALTENLTDIPETGDFSDFAHVYAIPHVGSATLDRRMRHYVRIASERMLAQGGANYSQRVYENLGVFIGRNQP